MNEKPDMMINIYGGNNLIAPVASSAIQNFYGDRGDEAADQPEDSEKTESTESVTDEKPAQEPAELSDDEFYVSVYIPDIKVMRAYKTEDIVHQSGSRQFGCTVMANHQRISKSQDDGTQLSDDDRNADSQQFPVVMFLVCRY